MSSVIILTPFTTVDEKAELWELGLPNEDGTSDAGTLIINQGTRDQVAAAGQSRKSPEVMITQLDQMENKGKSRASHATNPSKKRGKTPIDDEEKRKRKRMADEKHRNKKKEHYKNMEMDLKAAQEELKYYGRTNSLITQNLQNTSTQGGELHSAFKRLNENFGVQEKQLDFIYQKKILQEEVGKTEEESQCLKTENCKLRRVNQSSIVKNDTMKKDLQTAVTIIKQLLSKISTQQQLMDLYSSRLKEGPEHKKIQEWMRGIEESLNDCAEKEKANG